MRHGARLIGIDPIQSMAAFNQTPQAVHFRSLLSPAVHVPDFWPSCADKQLDSIPGANSFWGQSARLTTRDEKHIGCTMAVQTEIMASAYNLRLRLKLSSFLRTTARINKIFKKVWGRLTTTTPIPMHHVFPSFCSSSMVLPQNITSFFTASFCLKGEIIVSILQSLVRAGQLSKGGLRTGRSGLCWMTAVINKSMMD